jgi:hypothetical protein
MHQQHGFVTHGGEASGGPTVSGSVRPVARRIEIELTSARPDGSWTWRAAGAREPRGTLDGTLLYADAKPGDVVKAEAEFELEGILIISVAAPRADNRAEPQRIEVIGPARSEVPSVTTQLVGRRPGDRRRDRDHDDGRRRERSGARPQPPREGGRPRRERPERQDSDGGRPRRERPERHETADGARNEPAAGSSPQKERKERTRAPSRSERPAPEAREKAKRLNPANTHREAVLASLPPEQQPIAEQVLRGGIPAVRTALHLEREKAEAEGRPVPNTDELIAMAEALLPRLKAAEWRDRAEAAAAAEDEISIRDLRSVVAGADVARDDETRALAARLRDALDRRITATHEQWSADVSQQLDGNHVVRALRVSARPPDPSARLSSELSERLAQAAGQSMAPDTPPERWLALLEATAASPVRRNVQPAGLPEEAPPDLKRSAHQLSGSIPALATLLGVSMPPPPVPVAARRAGATRRALDRRPADRDRRGRGPRPTAERSAAKGPAGPASPNGGTPNHQEEAAVAATDPAIEPAPETAAAAEPAPEVATTTEPEGASSPAIEPAPEAATAPEPEGASSPAAEPSASAEGTGPEPAS